VDRTVERRRSLAASAIARPAHGTSIRLSPERCLGRTRPARAYPKAPNAGAATAPRTSRRSLSPTVPTAL